jgi:dipeptidyl aminopeptidase/acylaminoacyl peptidase
MNHRSGPLVALVLVLASLPALADPPALIPRAILLGDPARTMGRISPNGDAIAYLAPSERGVLNLWVRTLGARDDRMVTRDEHRGIRMFEWAEDGRRLLYLQDVAGEENFHLHRVDLADGSVQDLTPFDGVRAQNLLLDGSHPGELLVELNRRDPKVFDVYRIDLASAASRLDTENPGDVVTWVADPRFVIRAGVAAHADGSRSLRVRNGPDDAWRDLTSWPDQESVQPLGFAPDGQSIYVATSVGGDVSRLVRIDATTGKEVETLAKDPRCDVGEPVIDPRTHRLQAVSFNYARKEWKVIDPAVKADFEALAGARRGDFTITSRDRADRRWVVSHTVDDGPLQYSLYDRKKRKLSPLFVSRPELSKHPLTHRDAIVITTRDELTMVTYLTLPRGVPPRKLPMVLLVHGGPWERDSWGFDGVAQWLANRGYLVLQPNFRASLGFGKKYLHAGDRQWGGTMQNDLTDAVAWAIAKGYADPKRVAIMGTSYGGYAALAGLTFTPDLYACGIDVAGPSNLETLLEALPPYGSAMLGMLDLRMGDVGRDSLFNQRVSPLFHVDRIRSPLLVGHGANDPRVPLGESTRLVDAMRSRGLPVDFVVYADEGHGFVRPENRLDFYARVEQFLARSIGGRAEPFAPVDGAKADLK